MSDLKAQGKKLLEKAAGGSEGQTDEGGQVRMSWWHLEGGRRGHHGRQ